MKRKFRTALLSFIAVFCLAIGLTGCGVRPVKLQFELDDISNTYTVYAASQDGGGSLVIPSSYDGKPVTAIGVGAFYNCSEITSITIPDTVTKIGERAFDGCRNIKSITVSKENPVFHSAWNCVIESQTNQLILGCKTSDIPSGITSIGKYAFVSCDIESVTIPAGIVSIEDYAFSRCYDITSVTLPEGLISIGEHAFGFCDFTDISIPDSVTSIGEQAFFCCRKIESITVSAKNPVYHSEDNCLIETATNKLLLGCMNSVIPDSVTSIEDYAFYACFGLRKIAIPDSVTAIGESAFGGCFSLRKVEIGKGVTSIGDEAFKYCDSLEKIIFQGTTTQWKAIQKGKQWRYYTPWLSSVECTDGTLTEDDIG